MASYKCLICGYVYDPAEGDSIAGIAAGTAFEDLPDDWVCPVCGAPKSEFEKYSVKAKPRLLRITTPEGRGRFNLEKFEKDHRFRSVHISRGSEQGGDGTNAFGNRFP